MPEVIDPLDARIAELEANLALAMERIAELEAKVAELTARLNHNSTNSSKPPSSDPPGVPRQAKSPSGRKPGGQPGHKRRMRELVPVDFIAGGSGCRFAGLVRERSRIEAGSCDIVGVGLEASLLSRICG